LSLLKPSVVKNNIIQNIENTIAQRSIINALTKVQRIISYNPLVLTVLIFIYITKYYTYKSINLIFKYLEYIDTIFFALMCLINFLLLLDWK
jgi:hypothetical protein